MKLQRNKTKTSMPRKRTRVRTSILELMQELAKLTNDDNLVIAAVKNIFGGYNVRLAAAAVPVRLVNTELPDWNYLYTGRRRKKAL